MSMKRLGLVAAVIVVVASVFAGCGSSGADINEPQATAIAQGILESETTEIITTTEAPISAEAAAIVGKWVYRYSFEDDDLTVDYVFDFGDDGIVTHYFLEFVGDSSVDEDGPVTEWSASYEVQDGVVSIVSLSSGSVLFTENYSAADGTLTGDWVGLDGPAVFRRMQ